jgi:hypothetical protein
MSVPKTINLISEVLVGEVSPSPPVASRHSGYPLCGDTPQRPVFRNIFPVILLSLMGFSCRCSTNVSGADPSISLVPTSVDFGQVKTLGSLEKNISIESTTKGLLTIESITIEGDSSFTISSTKPTSVAPLSKENLNLTFKPLSLGAFTAQLVIKSNDKDRPLVKVPLVGEGAKPILEVTPECAQAVGCTVQNLNIEFGAQPMVRAVPLPVTQLPLVNVVNAGPVALQVTKFLITGTDASAFTFADNQMIPAGNIVLEASAGFNRSIRFVPTSMTKSDYRAQLEINSDDSDKMKVVVELHGTLKPNTAPNVCFNLVRVIPPPENDAPRDYSQQSAWTPLLVPPTNGYDFTLTRDVRPNELVVFSAFSNANDASVCTTDFEDARVGLSFEWKIISGPVGMPVAISGSTTSQAQLRPVITGEYVIELTVKDSQASAVSVRAKFHVVLKQDLVVQLQWPPFSGVDLDLHLIRPSSISGNDDFTGAFSFFSSGPSNKTAGDINGFSVGVQKANAGFNFDWGNMGSTDDPKLNLDDTGAGPLVENISLNFPENDAACATSNCTYSVMAHYFKDARALTPSACVVTGANGCKDGSSCVCAMGSGCVADNLPRDDAGVGSGKCYAAPKPELKIFFKGNPMAAVTVPLESLMPKDDLSIGAPCQLLELAQISWPGRNLIGSLPDGGTPPPVVFVPGTDAGMGRVVNPNVARFGFRQMGSLQCSPDISVSGIEWYGRRP